MWIYTQKESPDLFGRLAVNFLRNLQAIFVMSILMFILINVCTHAHYITFLPIFALPSIYPSLALFILFSIMKGI